MGRIEDVTRDALRERQERERAEAEARAQARMTEWVLERRREEERLIVAQGVLRRMAERVLKDLLSREVPGDHLVAVSVRKRALGFLWHYTVQTGSGLAAWELTTSSFRYLLLSDGRLAIQRGKGEVGRPGVWLIGDGDVSDALKALYARPHARIKTPLYQELMNISDWQIFDDTFCKQYLGFSYRVHVLGELDSYFAAENQRQGKGTSAGVPMRSRRRKRQ